MGDFFVRLSSSRRMSEIPNRKNSKFNAHYLSCDQTMTPPALPPNEPVELVQPLNCPRCQKGKVHVTKTIYAFPTTKESVCFLLFQCDQCDYRSNDVVPLETEFGAGTFTLQVKDGDLTAKIFRSPNAEVRIPEIDVEITPGPSAEFFITNVEGVLDRVERATRVVLQDEPESIEMQEVIDALEDVRAGRKNITIILTDPLGGSYVDPPDLELLEFQPMSPEEQKKYLPPTEIKEEEEEA